MEKTNHEMRASLKNKKRIVIKVGSASITHKETGSLDLRKIEKLVRVISDLNAEGKDVILVSSGAIATGRSVIGMHRRPRSMAEKQAFAAIGQARLMMTYQKIFSEYSVIASQVLLTKNIMLDPRSRMNATNTFLELLNLVLDGAFRKNKRIAKSLLYTLQLGHTIVVDDSLLRKHRLYIKVQEVIDVRRDLLGLIYLRYFVLYL